MSALDQAIETLALGDGDELCLWYRRPDTGRQASSSSSSRLGLCGECASLTQEILLPGARTSSSTSHTEQGDVDGASVVHSVFREEVYTFQKPYSQLRGHANFCALCRAIQDSVAITQGYAAGHNPTQIPPDAHVWLRPFDWDGDLTGFVVGLDQGENKSETDSKSSTESTSSDASSKGGFRSNPTWKGFLEVVVRETGSVRMGDDSLSSGAFKGRETVAIRGNSFIKAAPCQDMTYMLHSWLRECDSAHGVCRDHKNSRQSSADADMSASPARLLEIQQFNGLFHTRLVAGNETRTRYVALSHRWGDYRSIRTTTLNIESYQESINFGSLPLTLQQAVQITHMAGVRHIWVDCLCIIQDDDDDWAQEAPKMGSVYAGAYFTVAASAFEDAGCFPLKFSEDHRVTIDVRPGLELHICPRSSEFTRYSMEHEPLQKRGWTLQERLLSQRILYCSRYEYYWLCREQRLRAWGDPGRWFGYHSVMPTNEYQPSLLLSNSPQSQRAALTRWYLLMFDYSDRQLTLDKDKLIAITGLVDIFQRWIGSRYLHGLWECDLACGLVWHPGSRWFNELSDSPTGSFKSFEPDRSRFRRTRPTRAPSWSWASVDGFQEHFGPQLSGLADHLGQPLGELAYVKATAASDDEHRSCLGGGSSAGPLDRVLRITGRLSKAFYGYEDADEEGRRFWQVDRKGGIKPFQFYADDPDFDGDEHIEDAASSRLYVLPIIAYMGLVITPASDDANVPLYRRVGACNFMIPLVGLGDHGYGAWSEGSTAATDEGGNEQAAVQTDDDSIIDGAPVSSFTNNKTSTEALNMSADAASSTQAESESGSKDDPTESEDASDGTTGFGTDWQRYSDQLRWLGKAGAIETIFLC